MGTVEMLVLYLLNRQELYGYQITSLLEKLSGGRVVVTESTLYPTLYKLLNKRYISDREVPIGKRRLRVYYRIEDAGRQRLSDLLEDYNEITIGIAQILNSDINLEESEDNKSDE